ncbi:hypothetical protein LQ948_02715 [Jiella sp. MQZ9-1]|uniref:DUF4760 domain-containing protein n=1 Tax=Jiella flava TaxID=2816857 RepID=A0A939JVP1_9HYPH|nr:hypothetical protein [Jiella flava]MBO0661476.1 hypothetical protein [Jiella flava]MCD2470119.1 hypothetical protein [Jiella flava]
MELPTLTEAGVWGSIVSGLAAAVALGFNARMLALQQKSNDATTLFAVVANIREAETRLTASVVEPIAFKAELNNYLNLLETFAAAVNHKLFGKSTLCIATDRLITDLGMLLSDETTREQIRGAVTSDETFSELRAFWRRNRMKVNAAIEAHSKTPDDHTDHQAA